MGNNEQRAETMSGPIAYMEKRQQMYLLTPPPWLSLLENKIFSGGSCRSSVKLHTSANDKILWLVLRAGGTTSSQDVETESS